MRDVEKRIGGRRIGDILQTNAKNWDVTIVSSIANLRNYKTKMSFNRNNNNGGNDKG